MSLARKSIFISIVWLSVLFSNAHSQQSSFSKEQVLEDLNYLMHSLEEAHYNLYAYVPKETIQSKLEEVTQAIEKQDSLDLLTTTSFFQQIISSVNTGHAEIDFPIRSYIGYAQIGGTLFPLEIALENDQAFVRKNWSGKSEIKKGMQLISINGQEIESILQRIYPQLSAERPYFKNAKLEFWSFPRLYWQVFGEQKSFDLELKYAEGNHQHTVESISVMDYENNRDGEILYSDRDFYFIDDVAYVNPGPFSSTVENGEALYKSFIDSVFTEIRQSDTTDLIVDLRNNSGGHNAYSDYLVSYFADEPFKWHSKFTLKTSEILKEQTRANNDTTDVYFRTILDKPSGEIYEYEYQDYEPVAKEKRFDGEVYVLINRQSYSMAAVTAGMIQDYGFATIVGEETGDLPTLYASQFSYNLPNTGINIKVPKGYMIRPNGNEDLKGVTPDIEIRDRLLDDEDEILDSLLEYLDK